MLSHAVYSVELRLHGRHKEVLARGEGASVVLSVSLGRGCGGRGEAAPTLPVTAAPLRTHTNSPHV